MMPIKILVADDHRLFRQGLVGLMETRPDIVEIVGEAENGQEAIDMARGLQPDVILLDIYMPVVDGLKAASVIRAEMPQIAVVILTSSESDEHLFHAVRLGISGYLLKNVDADELFEMLCGVVRGEAAITRAIVGRILKGEGTRTAGSASLKEKLTEREIEVLDLVAQGLNNTEIGQVLVISRNTVKTHLRNILYKLNLDNRIQIATYAVQNKAAAEM
jgi:DNA-binding NarL/FixJ family response regulator